MDQEEEIIMPFKFIGKIDTDEKIPQGSFKFVGNVDQAKEEPKTEPLRVAAQGLKYIAARNPVAMGLSGIGAVSAGSAKRESLNEVEDLKDRGLINEEQYQKASKAIESQDVEGYAPTLENLYKLVEAKTGIPLEAKSKWEKAAALGSEAAGYASSFGAGPIKQLSAGILTPTTSQVMQQAGIPEPVSNLLSLPVGANLNELTRHLTDLASEHGPKFMEALSSIGTKGPIKQPTPPELPSATPYEEITKGITQKAPSYDVGEEAMQHLGERAPEYTEPSRIGLPQPQAPQIQGKPTQITIPPSLSKASQAATKASTLRPGKAVEPTSKARKIQAREGGPDVGYRPTGEERPTTFENQVGRIITRNAPEQPGETGFAYKSNINENARRQWQDVNNAYKESDELLSGAEGTSANLANSVNEIIGELEAIDPLRITPQENILLNWARSIRNAATSDEGPQVLNALDLSKQVQKINKIQSFDLEQGDQYGLLNRLKTPLNDAIKEIASQGFEDPDASPTIQALRFAKSKYIEFSDVFNNPNIVPFRKTTNTDFNKLYKEASSDLDTFSAFQRAMRTGNDPVAINLSQVAKKNLVNKELAEYIKNPKEAYGEKFEEKMHELDYALSPQESRNLRAVFNAKSRQKLVEKKPTIGKKVEAKTKVMPSQTVARGKEVVAKPVKKVSLPFEKQTPEEFIKSTTDVSGLKLAKKEMMKVPGWEEKFERLARKQAHDIVSGGKEVASPEDVLKAIENIDKRRFLQEAIGNENVQILQKRAQKILENEELAKKYSKFFKEMEEPKTWIKKYLGPKKIFQEALDFILDRTKDRRDLIKDFFSSKYTRKEVLARNKERLDAMEQIVKKIKEQSKSS